jgi:inosine/xanthosine triphosphatase
MPLSDHECIVGARNRARSALQEKEADLGIGLEGGVNGDPNGLFLLGWVVAVCSDGREGIGGTARIPLPKHMADRINDGEELGDVIDEILGEKDIKMKGGTVGALTDGLVPRREAFATAVAYALSPFLVPQLHDFKG